MQKIDYSTLSGEGKPDDKGVVQKRWWLADKAERAASVMAIFKQIAGNDSKRQTQYQVSARLYGNVDLMGVSGQALTKTQGQSAPKDRISFNVIQSGIDTLVAKMAKNKPKPLFLTSGGDYKIQRKAKKLDKFVEGVFYENEAYDLGKDILRDALVAGDGIIHVFEQNERVRFERVFAGELFVDSVEAVYGKPRQMHRVKNVDRDVLMDLFPEHKDKIRDALPAMTDASGTQPNVADQVMVVESWHLPSGPEADDGLHSINIEGATLHDEDWERDFFPFAILPWTKRMTGFWSQSAAEQVQNIQLEVNKILWIIQRSFHLAGSFKVLVENGSKVVKEHISNDIGAIITYTGTPPQYVVPQIVPMEMYQHLQNLKQSAYEQLGISQLSANSQKPAGLNSGKALREYNDIETERFMTVGQRYEKFFLDLAKLSIAVATDIFTREGAYEVKVPGKKFIQTIDWKDVNLEDDQYIMKVFPVSSLPSDPAGRLQTVQEYAQAGMYTPRTARKLLDFPDLEQVDDLLNCEEDYIHKILEAMVEDGKYTPPEPFDDLAMARELALEYYAQGKLNGLEEEKLELLRKFMDQVDLLAQKGMPQPAPGAGGPMPGGGAPQGPPMPPQASDLLPNAPQA